MVELGAEILFIPDNLSLGESVAYALTMSDARGEIEILHGDTFVQDETRLRPDEIAVSFQSDSYTWGVMSKGENRSFEEKRPITLARGDQLIVGWFCFSSAPVLLRALTKSKGDFLKSLSVYNDELPVRARAVNAWLDFGHLQTFYKSRTKARTARSFNSVSATDRTVFKSGEKSGKIFAEARWYEELPPALRLHIPCYLGREGTGYRLGYEFNPTLHELYIFGRLGQPVWSAIIESCFEFMSIGRKLGKKPATELFPQGVLKSLTTDKTLPRLQEFSQANDIDLDREWVFNGTRLPSLRRIVADCATLVSKLNPVLGVMHGDLCFPNMFYDFRQERIKVIDPRGSVIDGQETIYGDICYDLAKLNHSVEGYDAILSGRYHFRRLDNYSLELAFPKESMNEKLASLVADFDIEGYGTGHAGIKATTINLFLSMIPLHADRPDRQQAFLANALRLYSLLEARS